MVDGQDNKGASDGKARVADTPRHRRADSRLRERTDELELIISGLTMFVLFVTPTWIYQQYGANHLHYSYTIQVVMQVIMVIVPPLCYALAGCFTIHLCSRAYWIGLIGLLNGFPKGVNWDNSRVLGPISRNFLQARLPDLTTAIERADKVASSLFAIISLLGLVVLWWILLFTPLMILMVHIGGWFGASLAAVSLANWVIVLLIPGSAFLLWLLDAVLARRNPALAENGRYRRLVRAVQIVVNFIFLSRLIMPQKLTLQSNTWPVGFSVVLAMVFVVVLTAGPLLSAERFQFAPFGDYDYMDSAAVRDNYRSSHYEELRVARDALLIVPMIPSEMVSAAYIRLFLPYHAVRDTVALRGQCTDPGEVAAGHCPRRLWQVQLNDNPPMDMDGFRPSERRDLGMRGLIGYIPMQGLEAGPHELTVTWYPLSKMAGISNDFIPSAPVRYRIPFVFAPAYEFELPLP